MSKFRSSLRVKITVSILLGTLIFSSLVILVIFYYLNKTLTASLIEQGKIVGINISELAAEKLIEEDLIALKRIIEKYRHYASIEYILVEDFNHNIKTDTYNGNIPESLLNANIFGISSANEYSVKMITLPASDKPVDVYDILVPVKEGLMGFIRIGMKKSFVDTHIKRTLLVVSSIIAGGTLVAILVALMIITVQVTRPVLQLTEAARNISMGNFDSPVEIHVKNELQVLAEAIERMRESLKTCLSKLKSRPITHF